MSGSRNDMQVDALVRRLDAEQRPPRGFVDETYELIRAHADEARRHDASRLGRLRDAFPIPAMPAWQRTSAWRPTVVLFLALVAVLVWVAFTISGPGTAPPALRTDHVIFGRGHAGVPGYDLWVVGRDGSDAHVFVAGSHEPSRVSADGTRILSPIDGALVFPRIYRGDGTRVADLHPDPTLNLGVAAWSRDGQWLAFEAWDDTDHERDGVYLMHPDGTDLHRLTSKGVPGDFSPDDTQIVLTRQEGLFLVNVDGTNEHQIGNLKPVAYSSPGYFADGRSIYATAEGKLWVIDVAAGSARSLEVSGGDITVPRLSPDGRTFVFVFSAASADTTALWVMNADGSASRKLVDDPTENEDFADWLP